MPVANLVFDLDGTLVDSLPGIEASLAAAIEENFGVEKVENLGRWIGPPIHKMIRQMYPGASEEQVKGVERAFRRHYDSKGHRLTSGYPMLTEVLSWLKSQGWRLFILTNKPAKATQLIAEMLGISVFFEGIVCVDSVEGGRFESKTAAAEYCASKHGLLAGETYMAGDSEDDAAAAACLNWKFIAVEHGYGKIEPNSGITVKIKSLKELEGFFASLGRMS